MSIHASNEGFHSSGVQPFVQLEGTEAGAKNLKIRENGGVVEIYDVTAAKVLMTIDINSAMAGNVIFDTAANRPAAGVAGRAFISTDTLAVSFDTGSAWTLAGTLAGLDLSAHSDRHKHGGGDYPGYYLHLNKSGASETAGVSGAYGTGSDVAPDSGYYSEDPCLITATIGGTVGTSETISANVTITYDNTTAAQALAAKSLAAGATGDLTWDLTEKAESYVTGGKITKVTVAASSDQASTSATVVGNVKGIEVI